ncbi:MAG: hypothetical protein NZ552_04165 [Planctomycetes bacterium]|nr:hypothetical protein [Planctomycetota bacterium]
MARALGLDIGSEAVRAAVVDGARLVAWAEAPRRAPDGSERPLATVLAELAASVPSARAVVASSELEALARFLHLPPLPPERVARVLRLELLPDDEQDQCADAVRLTANEEEATYLGVVAPAEQVRELQRALRRSGLRPAAISWGPLALATLAARQAGEELALVVDLGATGSDLALVSAGRVHAARRLPLGVRHFLQAIIDAGGEARRAPEALRELASAAFAEPQAAELAAAPASEDLRFDEDGASDADPRAAALRRAADAWASQIATALAFFRAQLKRRELPVAEVRLSGGGALLPGLAAYLGQRLQLPVSLLDPLSGLSGAPPAEPARFARALGLALSLDDADVPPLDLRPEAEARREAWLRELLWLWVTAAALLVAGLGAALGLLAHAERDRAQAARLAAAVAEQRRLGAELAALEAERDALREDLRAIVVRVHAARDLLYTVRALKEQTRASQELWVTELRTIGVSGTGAGDSEAAGGSRLAAARGGQPPRRDSLIERGGIELAGRVRFDAKKSDVEMVSFIERYQRALAEWRTPEGSPLFRHVVLKNRRTERKDEEFSFRFHCFFPYATVSAEQLAVGEEGGP